MKVEWNPGRSKKGSSQTCKDKELPCTENDQHGCYEYEERPLNQQKLPRQVSTKIFLLCKVRMARNLRDHRVH